MWSISRSTEPACNSQITPNGSTKQTKLYDALLPTTVRLIDRERSGLKSEVNNLTQLLDYHTKHQAQLEQQMKAVTQQCNEMQLRLDEANRTVNDLNNSRQKLERTKVELEEKLDRAERLISGLTKAKSALATQAEDATRRADHENRERVAAEGRQRAAEHSVNTIQTSLQEEEAAKVNLQHHLAKITDEAEAWRTKYNELIINTIPPLEEENKKLVIQLHESRGMCATHETKILALEKNKALLAQELRDSQAKCDYLRNEVITLEKKQKAFDKTIAEWKVKADDLAHELDASQKECRNYSTELFKTKATYDEALEHIELLKRENKSLQDELKNVLDQLAEEGSTIQNLLAQRKKLENERDDALVACEEADATIERQENKLFRAEVEKEQIRQDCATRLQEKEQEFNEARKNFQKALDQLQTALESEARAKVDALHKKKVLEADFNKMEIELENVNKSITEAQATIRRYQNMVHEAQKALELEQMAHDEMRKACTAAERRYNETKCILEETRELFEQSERGRKSAEAEVDELRTQGNETAAAIATLSLQKRKLEGELVALHSDLDETIVNVRQQEETAKKAMVDCARLADELTQEQHHSADLEKVLKNYEHQVRELQEQLDLAQAAALAAGRKQIAALEAKFHQATVELETEKRQHADTAKNYRKDERRIKELMFQIEEDQKNHQRLQDVVDRMQHKAREYQRQIEEAEEIASLSMSKYRKCQEELEDAEARASTAENNLAKFRARQTQPGTMLER
ncbi:myosin heavy chain, muscle-like isoform X2 [Varroa destructor]|uniref:Paramyosin n=1 Tax=Varroa destructor TaxID=109461 RepID=A0A7M7K3W9_VARDE|nr:myosin heavy chain, muscle-like isoform X2 [Varroa destructor]